MWVNDHIVSWGTLIYMHMSIYDFTSEENKKKEKKHLFKENENRAFALLHELKI